MSIGITSLLLIVLVGMVLLSLIGWGVFLLLVQLGVIVNEARKPAHHDTGTYRLDQGRDVGKEQQ